MDMVLRWCTSNNLNNLLHSKTAGKTMRTEMWNHTTARVLASTCNKINFKPNVFSTQCQVCCITITLWVVMMTANEHSDTHAHKCPGHCLHTTADDILWWESVSIFELETLAAFATMHRCSNWNKLFSQNFYRWKAHSQSASVPYVIWSTRMQGFNFYWAFWLL